MECSEETHIRMRRMSTTIDRGAYIRHWRDGRNCIHRQPVRERRSPGRLRILAGVADY